MKEHKFQNVPIVSLEEGDEFYFLKSKFEDYRNRHNPDNKTSFFSFEAPPKEEWCNVRVKSPIDKGDSATKIVLIYEDIHGNENKLMTTALSVACKVLPQRLN